MDRNSITGIVLIMGMLLGYQYFFAPKEVPEVKAKAVTQKAIIPKDTAKLVTIDSSIKQEQIFTLENKDIIVKVSSKGAKLVSVQLKNYKSYANFNVGKSDGLYLYNAASDEFSVELPTAAGKVKISNLDFTGFNQATK